MKQADMGAYRSAIELLLGYWATPTSGPIHDGCACMGPAEGRELCPCAEKRVAVRHLEDALAFLPAPTDKQTEIKPCPFCGADSGWKGYDPWSGAKTAPECWVECEFCGASSRTSSFPENALAAWNTRTPTDKETDE